MHAICTFVYENEIPRILFIKQSAEIHSNTHAHFTDAFPQIPQFEIVSMCTVVCISSMNGKLKGKPKPKKKLLSGLEI